MFKYYNVAAASGIARNLRKGVREVVVFDSGRQSVYVQA